MDLYELPKFEFPELRKSFINFPKFWKKQIFWVVILTVLISSAFGFAGGILSGSNLKFSGIRESIEEPATSTQQYTPQTTQETAIIGVVKTFSPAVVSIVITKDVPIIEQYYYNPFPEFGQEFQIPQYRQNGTQKQEVGGGTGFIVSEDGMILTNKHVVLDTEAEYTVLTNDGKSYPAKVLARDPIQDLAVIKISQEKTVNNQGDFTLTNFPVVKLGDSDSLQIGQTVIAI
ncbi:MAG: hypothetical protein COX92_00530, partial [Candidatus Nealsonbacteria bacterium CG_4_10_14_0_2_um_filter_40_15]